MNEPMLGDAVLFYPSLFRERYKESVKNLIYALHAKERVMVCAVDIAQSLSEAADRSAWCIALRCIKSNRKWVLDGNTGRMGVRELAREVGLRCEDLGVDYCFIEDPLKESTDPEKQSIIPKVFREEFFAAGIRTKIRTVRPDKDKYRRALKVQPMAERREILWPESPTPGLRKVFDEVLRFPLGAHDDGLDAFVHCMRKLDSSSVANQDKDFIQMGTSYAIG
jgi:predicted phage terminase large subunit-like protein